MYLLYSSTGNGLILGGEFARLGVRICMYMYDRHKLCKCTSVSVVVYANTRNVHLHEYGHAYTHIDDMYMCTH